MMRQSNREAADKKRDEIIDYIEYNIRRIHLDPYHKEVRYKQANLRHFIEQNTLTLPVTIPSFLGILLISSAVVHTALETALHNAAVETMYAFLMFGCFVLSAFGSQHVHDALILREQDRYSDALQTIKKNEHFRFSQKMR